MPDKDAVPAKPSGPRPWVIYGLGTALMLVNAWFGTYAYVVVQALIWTQTSLLRGPVVFLFLLALLNLPIVRFARRFALSQAEMLILYGMIAIGTCAGGYGFVQILVNQMAVPFYYAGSNSGFTDRLQPQIASYLAPRDPEVLNGFFRGNSSLYRPEHLQGWATPVLFWSGFITTVFLTLLCLASLFRKQWVESERLTFPLVLLPIEMSERERPSSFWGNRWMWLGFVLAGVLESVNFLNFLYPAIPALPIKPGMGQNEIGELFTSRPMNAMGRLALSFYPFAIGIGYLLALDVSFSSWFLYLASKVALVLCAALGLSDGATGSPTARMPYIREQGLGAFVGIAAFSIAMAWKSLKQAWVLSRTGELADGEELMPLRVAVYGAGIGLALQTVFLMLIGLSPIQSALFVLVYACFAMTLARIVSEVGAGWAWAPSWSPTAFVGESIGINHLSPKQAVALFSYTSWTNDMRDNPWPQTAQSMKMATQSHTPARVFLAPLIFATVVGVFAGFWAHLDIYYMFGAATAKVRPALANGALGPSRQAVTYMITPTLQDWSGIGGAFFGGAVAIGLSLVRQRLAGFVLHPLGYAMAMTNTMEYMWCPFFIAWGAKAITLRYGGIRAYRAAVPFFLGMILGDYVVPTLWGIFGMVTHTQMYMAFPH